MILSTRILQAKVKGARVNLKLSVPIYSHETKSEHAESLQSRLGSSSHYLWSALQRVWFVRLGLHMSVGSTIIMKHKQYHTKHKIHTVVQDHHILGSFGAVTTGLFLAIICRPSAL